jgi:hypothetical protein
MNKMNLEPGVKYRGTGWVNEYGEFQFTPEQKGSKPSNLKIVHQGNDFVIYESAHLWQVKVNFKKTNVDFENFLQVFTTACSKLVSYLRKK